MQSMSNCRPRGWTLAPTGGSVTVFATDNIHDQQEIETMYDGLGGGWGGGPKPGKQVPSWDRL
jgi:hypothetical protein